MKAAIELEAAVREPSNKGAARALRREGKVPAIIYGEGQQNVTVSLEANVVSREYLRGGFFSKIVELKTGKESIFALPKDIQLHPVSDKIEHMDFFRVTEKSTINVLVPVHFHNMERCPGLKRGGNLNVVRHDLELTCSVNNIPGAIDIDLINTNIGDSIHISHIELPEGVEPAITDRDFTVATITGRGGKQEAKADEDGDDTEAAEGEEKAESKEAKDA